MCEDEEYGDTAVSNREFLSYFSEVIARPRLREWLEWDDDQRRFNNENRLRDFYELLVTGKIRRQTDIRSLHKILEYTPSNIDRLLTEEGYTMDEAFGEAVRIERAQSVPPTISWRTRLRDALRILRSGISLPFGNEGYEAAKSLAASFTVTPQSNPLWLYATAVIAAVAAGAIIYRRKRTVQHS